jgi:hypothetical protein
MTTPNTCEREPELLAALASRGLTEELRAHLEACPDCREAQEVWTYLAGLGEETLEDAAPLPAPGLIWWRAQLAAKRNQAEESVAAIKLATKTAVALTLALVCLVAIWWGPQSWEHLPVPVLGAGIALLVLLFSAGTVLYVWARGKI